MRTVAIVCCLALVGCAGEFGVVSRAGVRISENSRITARNIVPDDGKFRDVAEHLALAEEIYEKQLAELRKRRTKLRSRKRSLSMGAFATFAVTTLAVSATAIAASDDDSKTDLTLAGYGALGGLGVGTTLEVLGFMQEDPASVDAKITHLQSSYDSMLERIQALFADGATEVQVQKTVEMQAGAIIEDFISDALQINVRG